MHLQYVDTQDGEIIRRVQAYCADIHEQGRDWTTADGEACAAMLRESDDPWGLFRFMDEKTGSGQVGYRTQDGREWFHILRQMRNTPGSGLLEGITWHA